MGIRELVLGRVSGTLLCGPTRGASNREQTRLLTRPSVRFCDERVNHCFGRTICAIVHGCFVFTLQIADGQSL
jgi:hypothetical protein